MLVSTFIGAFSNWVHQVCLLSCSLTSKSPPQINLMNTELNFIWTLNVGSTALSKGHWKFLTTCTGMMTIVHWCLCTENHPRGTVAIAVKKSFVFPFWPPLLALKLFWTLESVSLCKHVLKHIHLNIDCGMLTSYCCSRRHTELHTLIVIKSWVDLSARCTSYQECACHLHPKIEIVGRNSFCRPIIYQQVVGEKTLTL